MTGSAAGTNGTLYLGWHRPETKAPGRGMYNYILYNYITMGGVDE